MSSSNEDPIVDKLMAMPASRLQSTFELLAGVMERNGPSHIGNLIATFSRQNDLPLVSNQQFLAAMEEALNRRMLLLDPEADSTNLIM